jgi:hypothetical protein
MFCSSLCCGSASSTAVNAVPVHGTTGTKFLITKFLITKFLITCLSTRASAEPRRVCLQELLCAPEVSVDYIEPVLHLFLSVYKIFVQHLEVSVFKSLCCICAFLSTRALFCICACLKSTRVLCCTWTCLPTRAQCMLYLEEHSLQFFLFFFRFFRNRFVCFSCFDKCSKHRNKPKKYSFWFHIGSPIFSFFTLFYHRER